MDFRESFQPLFSIMQLETVVGDPERLLRVLEFVISNKQNQNKYPLWARTREAQEDMFHWTEPLSGYRRVSM
jgi:hypothetical protein